MATEKRKAIFMDRDGTINRLGAFVERPEQLILEDGAAEAIKMVNEAGFLAIVVTNQPCIARGSVTEEGLSEIHAHMEGLLAKEGAHVDGIYYCPHYLDKNFKGGVPKFQIKCSCRKPEAGLIFKAAKDFGIDLAASWMVGDDVRDVQAGKKSGCRTALIGNDDAGQDISAKSLLGAAQEILSQKSQGGSFFAQNFQAARRQGILKTYQKNSKKRKDGKRA